MSKRKKGLGWFWYLLLIGYLFLLARNLEPLKTINEMHSAPWYLVLLALLTGGTVGFTLAFREGRVVRREIIAKRKERGDKESR